MGLAAATAVVAVPLVGAANKKSKLLGKNSMSAAVVEGPLVAHITNPKTGEIHLMFGEQEIVHHDPELVTQLLNAVKLPA